MLRRAAACKPILIHPFYTVPSPSTMKDRVDKQDSFDPLAKMTQRECKRVAGRFLKANGFFHVDELESTWRFLSDYSVQALSQTRFLRKICIRVVVSLARPS